MILQFTSRLINRKLFLIVLVLGTFASAHSQIGFNNPNPDPSAIIDAKANDKGILIPRMTTSARTAMTLGTKKPAHSLMVFDINLNMFFVYDTISNPDRWISLNPWLSQGNSNSDIVTRTNGKVGIGIVPTEKLDVNGNIKANGNVNASGNIAAQGNISAAGDLSGENVTASGTLISGNVVTGNVGSSGTVTANKFVGDGVIPSGGIIMWAGSTPPPGWALCDGANGTPDLRGRFIVGTGNYTEEFTTYSYPVGATGGEVKHELTIQEMPSHRHQYLKADGGGNGWRGGNTGAGAIYDLHGDGYTRYTGGDGTQAEGPGLPHENRPPYYALAYIMKLP